MIVHCKGNETTRREIQKRLYEKKSAGQKEAEAAAGRAWHSRASALELNGIKLIGKEWHREAGGEEVEAMKQRAREEGRLWHREAAGEEVKSV